MASFNFNAMVRAAVTGALDFDTDAFKVMLVTGALTETEKDAWANRSNVTGEVTGTGYTAGGVATTATVAATDTANNDVEISFSDVSWANSTLTARGAIIYKDTGLNTTDTVVAFVDFGSNVSSTNGTFSVDFTTPLKFQN